MTIDFNRYLRSELSISVSINEMIDRAEPPSKNTRQYLGASAIGNECLRKSQYEWMCDPIFPSRKKDIFERGHYFEARTREHLIAAGFQFVPPESERLKFEAVDGLFRGHADGLIEAGPAALEYPCIWEAKCLNAKGWKNVDRDGLTGLNAKYAAQVAVYQFYLSMTNPALFTVVNADTCERLFFTVPFDAQLAQEIIDRATVVINATRAGELLPRAYDSPEDWRCGLCSFKTRCWGVPS